MHQRKPAMLMRSCQSENKKKRDEMKEVERKKVKEGAKGNE
jgi:hypothetical protein